MALTVTLVGPAPWGFRISGGRDFKRAITVSKVNEGSKAELASLVPGDVIMEINGESTAEMLNVEAQNKIKNSKTQLLLLVKRPEPPSPGQTNGISTSEQLTGRFQEVLHVSRDENQNYREYSIPSPASLSPGPYSPEPPLSPDRKVEKHLSSSTQSHQLRPWSPVEKNSSHRLSRPYSQDFSPEYRSNSGSSRTPTPPGHQSPHSPLDREPPVSPRRSSDFTMQKFDRDSEVYKMIQENRESRTPPRQSSTFKMLQEVLEADENVAAQRFPGKLTPSPPKPVSVAGVQKFHVCEKCNSNIVNQAVRIADERYRHPECYTCSECDLNLKMRGHFWVGDEMFCEKHARQRYQGPGANYRAPISPHH
ncbi:PDZ and LIM domain protein 2 [Paramormyrops kingsleyae]|uniref:PDZ and LIM domain protein 2 n=1 Tax=Paramormyrops kingsleyae TaxID=1676925 RepID=UPI003B96D441